MQVCNDDFIMQRHMKAVILFQNEILKHSADYEHQEAAAADQAAAEFLDCNQSRKPHKHSHTIRFLLTRQ